MADSNLFGLDDTFDADESLLVSPAPKLTTADVDVAANPSFDNNFGDESFDFKSTIPDERPQFQFDGNEVNESMYSDDSLDDSFGRTPIKPKFSYASAMDALDDLVPSAMKVKRRATMFSFEHSSAKKMLQAERGAAGPSEGGLNESFDYNSLTHYDSSCSPHSEENREIFEESTEENGQSAILGVSCSAPFESTAASDELDNSCNGHSYSRQNNLNINNDGASNDSHASESDAMSQLESCNESPAATELDDIEHSTSLSDDKNARDTESKDFAISSGLKESPSEAPYSNQTCEQSSAFRYPCIRQDTSNMEDDLELKLGHPVNESVFLDWDNPQKIESKIAIEVEHDSFGESLDDEDRVDQVPLFQEVSEQRQFDCESIKMKGSPIFVRFEQVSRHSNDMSMQEKSVLLDESADRNVARNENIVADFGYHSKYEKLAIEEEPAVLEESVDNQSAETECDERENFQNKDLSVDEQRVALDGSTGPNYTVSWRSDRSSDSELHEDHPSLDDNNKSCGIDNSLDNSTDRVTDFNASSDELVHLQNNEGDEPIQSGSVSFFKSADQDSLFKADSLYETKHESFTDIEPKNCSMFASREEDRRPLPLSELSEVFSPIAKSSSPHNCDGDGINVDFAILKQDQTAPTKMSQVAVLDTLGKCGSLLHGNSLVVESYNMAQVDVYETKTPSLEEKQYFDQNESSRASVKNVKSALTASKSCVNENHEHIMMDKITFDTNIPAEDFASERKRVSMALKPDEIEGPNPYKSIGSRPLSSVTHTDRARRTSVYPNAPRSALPARKNVAPRDDDPYKPFKARPMPTSAISHPVRTPAALRPHSQQNKASVKPVAVNAKPPARLLSGRDASMAKETSLRQRVEKENDMLRKQSIFKARPMPFSATVPSGLVGGKLFVSAGKENDDSSGSRNRMPPAKPFIPHSTRRAEQRAAFDSERAQRESNEKARMKEKRTISLDKIKKDVDKLKCLIR